MTEAPTTGPASSDATSSALLGQPTGTGARRWRARRRSAPKLLVIPAALVALAALAPAAYLLLRPCFNLELLLRELNTPSTWLLIVNNVALLAGVCLLTGL